MERVYLLLRNNHQSGPFTIGELLQQQLGASDMIWVEGKSNAWTYLSELELSPLIKKIETSEQDKKASDEIEKKAEELRQRILSAPPRTYFPNRSVEIETYASPYNTPEDEIRIVDHRKERRIKKNTALGELLLTCLVIGIFVVGIFKGKSLLGARDKVQNSVATQLNSGDQHAAKKSTTTNQMTSFVADTVKRPDSLSVMQKNKQKIWASRKTVTDSVNVASIQSATTAINENNKKEEPVVQSPPPASQENNAKKEEDTPVKKETVASIPQVKTNSEPVKEEKRGFLRGLFKKKKNKEE